MKAFIRSLGFAWSGILFALRTQSHMRFHVFAAIVVCFLGYTVSLDTLEWSVILLTMAVVMSAEMLNTALEQVVDLASPEFHPIAKIAKDAAAGAVLIAAVIAAIIGLLIIGPPLWRLF